QRIILSQQAEIEELRRLGQDNVAFESRSRLSPNISSNAKAPYHKKGRQRSALIERKIQIRDNSRASTIATVGDSVGAISPPRVPSNRKSLSLNSEQCKKAEKTALKARESQDDSDKLFYYKTAARLCPDNPAFHINIARHYIKQGREEDAKFEFETALSLDPDNEEALAGLSDISQGIGE
ncbi:MAG: tetratricopeptide repeat protein, partial [Candidatus Dadabacteria bacterium]